MSPDAKSPDTNATVIRRWIEQGLSGGDLALIEETFDASYRFTARNGVIVGRAELASILSGFRAAFSDLTVAIDDLIACGDRVTVRSTYRGTHEGAFMGAPPTNRRVAWTGMTIYRLADGLVVEEWAAWDSITLAEQLGLRLTLAE